MKNYTVNTITKGKAIALSNAGMFDYNIKLLDAVGNIIERTRDAIINVEAEYRKQLNISRYINNALDAVMLNDDAIKWEMMKVYCTPEEANYYNAVVDFEADLYHIINEWVVIDLQGILTIKEEEGYLDVLQERDRKKSINFRWYGTLEELKNEYWDYDIVIL